MKTFKLFGFFIFFDRTLHIMANICYMCSDIHAGNATWGCADPFNANSPFLNITKCRPGVKQCEKRIFRYNGDIFITRMCANKMEETDGCREIKMKIKHTKCTCSKILCNIANSVLHRQGVYSLTLLYAILISL